APRARYCGRRTALYAPRARYHGRRTTVDVPRASYYARSTTNVVRTRSEVDAHNYVTRCEGPRTKGAVPRPTYYARSTTCGVPRTWYFGTSRALTRSWYSFRGSLCARGVGGGAAARGGA